MTRDLHLTPDLRDFMYEKMCTIASVLRLRDEIKSYVSCLSCYSISSSSEAVSSTILRLPKAFHRLNRRRVLYHGDEVSV